MDKDRALEETMARRADQRLDQQQAAQDVAKAVADQEFTTLHPTNKARAYRALSTWARKRAEAQEITNDCDGVPE